LELRIRERQSKIEIGGGGSDGSKNSYGVDMPEEEDV